MNKTKQNIIDKTMDLIALNGIENVSVRKIAKECNIPFSLVHYHFKNMDELITEALKEVLNINVQELRKIIDNSSSLRDSLVSISKYLIIGGIEHPKVAKTAIYPLFDKGNSMFFDYFNSLLIELKAKYNIEDYMMYIFFSTVFFQTINGTVFKRSLNISLLESNEIEDFLNILLDKLGIN